MRTLCEHWTELEISEIIENIKRYYSASIHSKKEVVFSGNADVMKEMLTKLSDLYASFNRNRVGNIKLTVVSLVQDYLYDTFTENCKFWKLALKGGDQSKVEARVGIIYATEEYEYESPDFHMEWNDNEIREYIGSIIFSSAQPDQRKARLEHLLDCFTDDTIPDIKRLFYKTFSSLGKCELSKQHLQQILEKSIEVYESDTLLYEDVVIPEDLLLSWESKPILQIMQRVASKKKIDPDFSRTLKDYFDYYVSFSSVPSLQEYLFQYFTERRKLKKLTDKDIDNIRENFVRIRRSFENQLGRRAQIPDEVFDEFNSGILSNIVHSYAFEKNERKIKRQTGAIHGFFSSFQKIPEPSDEIIFIKESKKSSEKIIDLTKQTLGAIEGSDNFHFIKEKLNKLIKAVEKEEKEQKFSELVQVLKAKVEKTDNKEVNLVKHPLFYCLLSLQILFRTKLC
jgi:hypothetical protein